MRTALVGLGNAGFDLHLPALAALPNAEIVGACDLDADRRRRAAERWGIAVFDDLDLMLSETAPEVVIVATPPDHHADHCARTFAAGADVICEKPLAPSLAQADEILAAAATAGRRIAVNHEFREMCIMRAVRDRIGQPGVGPLRFVQIWQNMNLPPWDEPGWRGELMQGVLFEAGIHLVDLALALFDERPVAVSATVSTGGTRPEKTDAIAVATLEFSDGRLANVLQNRLCRGDTQYFEVRADTEEASLRASFGGRARLSVGLFHSTAPHARIEYGPAGIAWGEQGGHRTMIARNPRDAGMVATRRLLEKTLDGFRTGAAVPADGQAGKESLEVVAACYHAAKTGRRVDLHGDDLAQIRSVPISQMIG